MTRVGLFLLIASCASQANAGIHATYKIADEEKPLIVDVADNGDASFTQAEGDARIVVTGKHAYIVGTFDEGVRTVRFDDITRAVQTAGMPPVEVEESLPTMAAVILDLNATPVGSRTVAGIAGRRYRLTTGNGTAIEGPKEIVATDAPELKPIGKAIETMLTEGSGIITLLDKIGPDLARWMRMLGKLAALGAPLEWKGLYELQTVETKRIPPETIAVPGKPLSPNELVARIRALSPDG